jgi:hypothetical protein
VRRHGSGPPSAGVAAFLGNHLPSFGINELLVLLVLLERPSPAWRECRHRQTGACFALAIPKRADDDSHPEPVCQVLLCKSEVFLSFWAPLVK